MFTESIINTGVSYLKVEQTTSYMTVTFLKRNLSVKFYLHPSKQNGEAYFLFARLLYMRKKAEFSLKILITPDEWDFNNGQLINKNKNMDAHKIMIAFESEAMKILDDRQARGLPVSAKIIKKIIKKEMTVDSTDGAIYLLLPYIDKTIELMRKNKTEYTPGTIQHYVTLSGHLKEYFKLKNKKDVPLHLIDTALLQDIDDHFITWIHPKLGRSMNRNTANKYHSKLRAVLHDATRRKLIQSNPYNGLKLRKASPKSDYLIDAEISLLTAKRFDNKSLELTLDYLLFSIWSGGIRFSDLTKLKSHNIFEEDGFLFFHFPSQEKTNNSVHTPLLPGAVEIYKKYSGYREQEGYILPRLSQQKLNEYLKTVGDLAGIHKRMTHKIARHTFGTTISSRNGVPRHITATWLGHSLQLRTTDIYAQVTKEEAFFWLKKLYTIYDKPEFKLNK